jgi:uncharacterized membrane protein YeaQ/YmgE (transglycosylase-associated protein family)
MFNILGMFISGFVVGVLARWFYLGTVDIGVWKTIALGLAGSFLAGLITQMASKPKEGIRLSRAGLSMSILGSILILFVTRQLAWW